MKDYMMALHQRFCKEPECREVRKELEAIHQNLYQVLDRQGQEQLLKLADLENELLDKTSLDLNCPWGSRRSWRPPTPSTMIRSSGLVRPSGEGGMSNGQEARQR